MSARSSPPRSGFGGWLAGILLFLFAAPALAQTDNALHGRLEAQDSVEVNGPASLQAGLGDRVGDDASGNLRLIWEPSWGDWSLQAHYLVSADIGPDVTLAR